MTNRFFPFIRRKTTRPPVLLFGLTVLAIVGAVDIWGGAAPTPVLAQAYGSGVYNGGVYNGGAAPAPSATSTPTSPTPTASLPNTSPTEVSATPTVSPTSQSSPSASPSAFPATVTPVPTIQMNGPSESGSSNLIQQIAQTLSKIFGQFPTPLAKAADNIGEQVRVLSVSIINHPAQTASLIAASASLAVPAAVPVTESLPYLQWRNLFSLFGLLFRRKRQPWGVIYDANTKEPLDPVVLTLTDSRGRQSQTISDIYGRYAFAVEPGTYTLTAAKTNYQFPSSRLAGRTSDEIYDGLYFGQQITINDAALLIVNIPMDPVGVDWNQAEKKRLGLRSNRVFWGRVSLVLFYGGLAWSLAQFVVHQTWLNSAILLMYAAILLGQLLARRQGRAGIIRDQSGQPVKGAVIRLRNLLLPQLAFPPVVTKQSGQFSFLAPKGTYQVTAELKGQDGTYHQIAASPKLNINKQTGIVRPNLSVGHEEKVDYRKVIEKATGHSLGTES